MKNKILTALTVLAAVSWIVSVAMLDSLSIVPVAVCGASTVFLALVAVANMDRLERV